MIVVLSATIPLPANGGGLSKAASRGAARSVGRLFHRTAPKPAMRMQRTLKLRMRQDRVRDLRTRPRGLARSRTVFRYSSLSRARFEARHGIPSGSHMTATGGPGRPVTGWHAQRRYGLPRRPHARETIRLQRGFSVRHNKVKGGAPGQGELLAGRGHRVPPSAIHRVVPLKGDER